MITIKIISCFKIYITDVTEIKKTIKEYNKQFYVNKWVNIGKKTKS